MLKFLIIIFIILFISFLFSLLADYVNTTTVVPKKGKRNYWYVRKEFMSAYEKKFYSIFQRLESLEQVKIVPQVNLASIIDKKGNDRYRTELFRNVDFGVFNEDYTLLFLVEIDDQTHNQKRRRQRDHRVNQICLSANIKVMHYHSNYPNTEEYIMKRMKQAIEQCKMELCHNQQESKM